MPNYIKSTGALELIYTIMYMGITHYLTSHVLQCITAYFLAEHGGWNQVLDAGTFQTSPNETHEME
jgi:hypothetical protein